MRTLLIHLDRPSVHPRRCGEHDLSKFASALTSGSSPQVRGTWPVLAVLQAPDRFIPAGAGNILVIPSELEDTAVHPRRCGEHVDR